ncbi:MAG: hypothetical protein N3A68_05330 [Bacteroidia bacterium]|nr:hypothetical protein [Bacteroidia bacterium]GIV23938.1 MAG: hypothetical protein KatS3mg025_1597 [Bacteroidia bacterium]
MRWTLRVLGIGAIGWTQGVSDSLQRLFAKDHAFDIVVLRSFPLQTAISDTFPVVPLLSGHVRMGAAWQWHVWRSVGVGVQAGWAWGREVLRATSASTAPYADSMPAGYRWLRYRFGAVYVQGSFRWERRRSDDIFPQYWIEIGGWAQRHIASSLKYVAHRHGRVERVRWDGVSVFSPWQGGLYASFGRQWIGLCAYYHLLPLYRRGTYGEAPPRSYPSAPRWEIGFLLAL